MLVINGYGLQHACCSLQVGNCAPELFSYGNEDFKINELRQLIGVTGKGQVSWLNKDVKLSQWELCPWTLTSKHFGVEGNYGKNGSLLKMLFSIENAFRRAPAATAGKELGLPWPLKAEIQDQAVKCSLTNY